MIKSKSIFHSFKYAICGIYHCYRYERNIRVHTVAGILALILAFFLHISRIELIILILLIAMVILAEIINTAAENIVDLVTPEFHPLAKIVKDIMAGGVLILSGAAVVIGILMFGPYIMELWR